MFEGLKARLDRLFTDVPVDRRAAEGDLREALIEAKAELAGERRQQADAERRGALAAEIGDTETAEIAARFATRHAERADVLQRKVEVQREELRLAEREASEIAAMFKSRGAAQAGDSVRAAWRDLEAAGGARPETDLDGVLQKAEQDRRLRDEAVDAQLAHLKKKFGKD